MYKALNLKPLTKTINPVIDWYALLPHAEAMAAPRIDVQLDRVIGCLPYPIQRHTWIHRQLIITGQSDKQRGRIVWNWKISPKGTIDGSREILATLRVVLERHTDGDSAACREAHDADAVWENAPLLSAPPHHFHGLLPVSNGQRSDLLCYLPQLVTI
jgi:hypothetical protein